MIWRHAECFPRARCSGHEAARGAAHDGHGKRDSYPGLDKEVDAPPANRPRGLTRVATVWGGVMNLRSSLAGAVAVALVFGATSTASAQADTTRRTTTSQTRVRVTKNQRRSRHPARLGVHPRLHRARRLARTHGADAPGFDRPRRLARAWNRCAVIRSPGFVGSRGFDRARVATATTTDTVRTPSRRRWHRTIRNATRWLVPGARRWPQHSDRDGQ